MMTTASDLVEQYLRRLQTAARSLARPDRDELVAEIRQHLSAALAPNATEADVRNVLESLGDPEEIVAAARPSGAAPPVRGIREILALVFLVTGFPPFIGWIIGLALLLWSPLWTARQKLLGALVWPGGWVAVGGLVLAGGQTACSTETIPIPNPASSSGVAVTTATTIASIAGDCTTGGLGLLGQVGVALVLLAPVVVAVYLYRAAGREL